MCSIQDTTDSSYGSYAPYAPKSRSMLDMVGQVSNAGPTSRTRSLHSSYSRLEIDSMTNRLSRRISQQKEDSSNTEQNPDSNISVSDWLVSGMTRSEMEFNKKKNKGIFTKDLGLEEFSPFKKSLLLQCFSRV
jgi:hypothetical protein